MDLTIDDVAEMLNVSEGTVRTWIEDGMPAYRIQDQHRFNRLEIEEWVLNQKRDPEADTSPFQRNEPEEQGLEAGPGGFNYFGLYRALHKGDIYRDIPGNTKEEVIGEAMNLIAGNLGLDAEVMTHLLLDRENLMPTALNNGIAVPHTRDFLLSRHVDMVSVVFPEKPIEYGALDNQPVHTLFFLFACDDRRHLGLLAKLAHLASQPSFLELLKTRPSKQELLETVKEWENLVKKPV